MRAPGVSPAIGCSEEGRAAERRARRHLPELPDAQFAPKGARRRRSVRAGLEVKASADWLSGNCGKDASVEPRPAAGGGTAEGL